MQITFWGAAQQVTGSMFLLELEDDYKILVDCGMDMERRDINPEDYLGLFPFEPSMIQAVILTHAHIDHSGYIPNLLREGFEGKIICTSATYELTQLLLADSATLNQKKIKRFYKKRKHQQQNNTNIKELYLHNQVEEAIRHFVTLPFNQSKKLAKGVYVTLIPAGHLLGAAHVIIEVTENGKKKMIGFSGDIGRYNYPLLPNPQSMPPVDYLVCESTYGNRYHQSKDPAEEVLLSIIQQACVDIPGKLIVPAFSVGRTQALLYTLNKLQVSGKLPPIKIFTDSPLALKSSKVYQKYSAWMNEDARDFAEDHRRLFDFENLIYVENIKESKRVTHTEEPCMIISSSGMIQGGRVEYHVRQNLTNPKATILMIGYSAKGTFGHELANGLKTIVIKNRNMPILAKIVQTDSFSGHGDLGDLIKFVNWQDVKQLKKLFLVHGEKDALEGFEQRLSEQGYTDIEIPKRGSKFIL